MNDRLEETGKRELEASDRLEEATRRVLKSLDRCNEIEQFGNMDMLDALSHCRECVDRLTAVRTEEGDGDM